MSGAAINYIDKKVFGHNTARKLDYKHKLVTEDHTSKIIFRKPSCRTGMMELQNGH